MKSLFALSIIAGSILTATSIVSAADGNALFEINCVKSHNADGKGDTKMRVTVCCKVCSDAKYQETLTDDKIAKAINDQANL